MSASQGNATIWAYFSPEQAYEFTVSTHILAGTLAIMCWDILNNLNNDYRLLFKYQVGLPTVAYFVSRLGALGFILTTTLLETSTIGSCKGRQRALACLYIVCIPATSLLFFFRVRAVFRRYKYVVWFFGFMWLAVVGAVSISPIIVSSTSIGSTGYCIGSILKPFGVVSVIVPLVNDTSVLLAVTAGLVMNTQVEPTLKEGIRAVVYGDYLPAFSRAILRDNQMYYLVTVGCNLLAAVMFSIDSLPIAYRTMFVAPNVMLMNVMACRVFRNTKFGNQWMEPTTPSAPRRGPAPNHAISVSAIAFEEPSANSSITHALTLISESDSQSRVDQGVVEEKLENADVIDIYSSDKHISNMHDDRNRGDSAA